METGYILAKTNHMVKEISDSLAFFPLIYFDGSAYMEITIDVLREKNPYMVVLSEELSEQEIEAITESIRSDKTSDYIAIILYVHTFTAAKWNHLLEKNRIDAWYDDSSPDSVKSFTLYRVYDQVKMCRELTKFQINNDYLQSEISFYDRKRMYKEGLEQKERIKDLINFMHFVRTYLTGIKGGVDLVLNEHIGSEEKKIATSLVLRNIHKIEEYINQQDFTVKEEKRSKTIQPIILKLRSLILNLDKQLVFKGREKNISVFSDFPQSDHSVLAKTPDLEILISSLLVSCLQAIKPGSTVKFIIKLLSSANMVEFSIRSSKESVDMDLLKTVITAQGDVLQILNDKDSKLELFDDAGHFGIRFYLPRLS
jgi:hypothetical protein